MKAFGVAARPLGWSGIATPSAALLIIAEDELHARQKAIGIWAGMGRKWKYAAEGEEQEYRTGRGPETPNKMWLQVDEIDWEARYFPYGTLTDIAQAYNATH